MAVQIYTPDTIKAGIVQAIVYYCQLLAKFAVRLALDTELQGFKINIPVDLQVDDLDFEVMEVIDGPCIDIMKTTIEHICEFQDSFILINALSIDALEAHQDGITLAVDLIEYFLVPPLENLVGRMSTDINGLYLNLIYLLHLFAYLLFYECIDMDSQEFESYWWYEIDEKVFHFMDAEEKNCSLLITLINQMELENKSLCSLWNNEK